MKALGRSLCEGYEFQRNGDRFSVTSPGSKRVYSVSVDACTCPDFTLRGGSHTRNGRGACKHTLMIRDLVELLEGLIL